jgi:hypothetical protein
MTRLLLSGAFVLSAVLSHAAFASDVDDAKQLQADANKILRASSGQVADPKVYAEAVEKLEKAQALLEKAADAHTPGIDALQQEVSASLFWARKFANTKVIDELQKNVKPPDPDAAAAAFKQAEQFEAGHAGDDYAIALRWFQFSSEFAGSDYAIRGLARAREAQARVKAAEDAKIHASLPADQKLIDDGNQLFQQKNFDAALAKYLEAKKAADTTLVERRIGHTYVEKGHALRDQYAAEYLPVLKEYEAAKKRGDQAAVAAVTKKAQDIVTKLKPVEDGALKAYNDAELAFQKGLALANGKDLECDAYLAFLNYDRGKAHHQKARQQLMDLFGKYHASNDEERTTFEFAKTLFVHMGGVIKN